MDPDNKHDSGDYDFDLPKRAEDPPPLPPGDRGGIAILVLVAFLLLTSWSIGELMKALGILK